MYALGVGGGGPQRRSLEQLSRLIASYPPYLQRRNVWGCTNLMDASYNNHIEIANFLIELGADVNMQSERFCQTNKQKNWGYTALMCASYNNHIEIAKLLINAGAKLDIRNNKGETALDFAKQQNHKEMIQILQTEEIMRSLEREKPIVIALLAERKKDFIDFIYLSLILLILTLAGIGFITVLSRLF
jgi:ankyrin repeat protein